MGLATPLPLRIWKARFQSHKDRQMRLATPLPLRFASEVMFAAAPNVQVDFCDPWNEIPTISGGVARAGGRVYIHK